MNDLVFNTLKEKDFIVKSYLLKVSVSLNLNLNDFILLIYFVNKKISIYLHFRKKYLLILSFHSFFYYFI